MSTDGFFNWIGETLGAAIRAIVEALSGVFGDIFAAFDSFLQGLTTSLGISPSIFSIVVLIIGLLLLFNGIRAFMRRSIVGGVVLTLLGLIVLSWLIQ
ncbi:hypothetical protein C7446_2612 [Kushneria sinocarnis]|uniref:Uncharacterized protein n=1 Tax=Kushneria sinocarnis TaxID=595502 RepID=A0A420WUT2_9GAMM|nr:hypothetical protein [Kushneria sinocarnis]RKQ97190.1 hypothetical protein C7446_2612 [Kushneria sinocarnis]